MDPQPGKVHRHCPTVTGTLCATHAAPSVPVHAAAATVPESARVHAGASNAGFWRRLQRLFATDVPQAAEGSSDGSGAKGIYRPISPDREIWERIWTRTSLCLQLDGGSGCLEQAAPRTRIPGGHVDHEAGCRAGTFIFIQNGLPWSQVQGYRIADNETHQRSPTLPNYTDCHNVQSHTAARVEGSNTAQSSLSLPVGGKPDRDTAGHQRRAGPFPPEGLHLPEKRGQISPNTFGC